MTWALQQDRAWWTQMSKVCEDDLRGLASRRLGYERLAPRLAAIRERVESITRSLPPESDRTPRVVDPVEPLRHGHARHKQLAEVVGERATLRWLVESFEQISITEPTLLEVHRRLYAGQHDGAGRYKTNPVYIINTPIYGEPPASPFTHTTKPEDIHHVMSDLHQHLSDLIKDGSADPMLLAGAYFADILRAHPFSDGNGRTSRYMFMLMLLKHGHAATPFLDLPYLFDARRTAYIAVAQLTSRSGPGIQSDPQPLIHFLIRLVNEAYTRLSERVDRLEAALQSDTWHTLES